MSYLLAAFSGLLTALIFPKFDLFFLAWISLIPLFFSLKGKNPRAGFFIGFVSGFAFYALLLYWIPSVPAHYGNMSPGMSFLVYLALLVFMALSWAVFGLLFSTIFSLYPYLSFLLAPFFWVSLEYTYTFFLTGFPWGLLGYSQVKNLLFLQLASITGVYGLSFVLVFFQSMFVLSISARRRAPFFSALAIVLAIHLGGFLSLKSISPDNKAFPAAVLQGNVSSDIHWDQIPAEKIYELFDQHLELSREAFREGAKLIIWPEFSVPLCFSCPQPIYVSFKETLALFVRETGCTLLVGTNETAFSGGEALYLNTALSIHPDLSSSLYHKMHLVPFGEYTPYKKIFFFIEKTAHAIGDITQGREHVLHDFGENKFGSPICYEIIFPQLVRKFVTKGAHFLVTITNDGWYGKTSAPYQHFQISVFRAVENRRYLLRAATTGVSGVVDPAGRVLARSEMMTRTFLKSEVRPSERLSFYTRYGDLLSYLGLTLTALALILVLIERRNERKKRRRGEID